MGQRIRLAIKDRQAISGNVVNPKHAKTVFVKVELMQGLAQWNMQRDSARLAIKLIQPSLFANQKFPSLSSPLDLTALLLKLEGSLSL
jgi:hypothetical protein